MVVDGQRIVSHRHAARRDAWSWAACAIAAGQVELVATDRAYEGRGLVRALMGWAHDRSARRGHLVQVMIGIPYFYRLFGYQYSIVLPKARSVRAVPPRPATWCDRPGPPTSGRCRPCRTRHSAATTWPCRTRRRAGAGSWPATAATSCSWSGPAGPWRPAGSPHPTRVA